MIKCEVSAENQNFGKPRVRYFEFVSFPTLKRLLVKIIIKMIFKNVNIWNTQRRMNDVTKSCLGKRLIHSKYNGQTNGF